MALDAHLRREVTARLRELGGEDRELAHRLGPRDPAVRGVDRALHLGDDLRVLCGIGERHRGALVVVAEPRRQHFAVEGHERRDERLLVSHHDDLADDRVGTNRVFERCGGDVLASRGHENLLLAPRDRDVAVVVELADVSRAEPLAVHDLGGGLGVLPVTAEHVDALDENLAIVVDLDTDAGQGGPGGTDLEAVDEVHRRGGRRLGEPVALEDLDAEAAEEVGEPQAEGSGAAHGVDDIAAHRGTQLAVDELVEERELELETERHGAGVERLRVRDGHVGRLAEDLALAAGLGLLFRRVVDLLEDAGDREEEGGLEGAEGGKQLLRVGLVTHSGAAVHGEDRDEAREDVRGRDEEQRRGARSEHLLHRNDSVAAELDEVRVGENDALRSARGARGVDEGRDVRALRGRAPRLEVIVAHVGTGARELLEVPHVHLPHVADAVDVARDLVVSSEVLGGLDDDVVGFGVLQDVLDLARRARLVDRHEHRAGEPRGEVDECPLVAHLAHEADLVAGLDSRGHEPLREGDDLLVELARRDIRPSAIGGGQGEERSLGSQGHAIDQQVGRVGVGVGGHHGGDDEFFHGNSFGTGRWLMPPLYPRRPSAACAR